MKRKWTVNEKIDLLYTCISILCMVIIMLLAKIFHIKQVFPVSTVVYTLLLFTPDIFRRRKQFRQIKIMIDVMDVSMGELRDFLGVSKYDLIAWEKGKIHLTPAKFYELEDYLQKKYFLQFKKEFNEKEYRHE